MEKVFQVTHPFHPRFGQEYALVTYRNNWGEDRAYFYDQEGRLCSLPGRWTSLVPMDPFAVTSAGRSFFHIEDLLELVRRVRNLPVRDGVKEILSDCKGNNAGSAAPLQRRPLRKARAELKDVVATPTEKPSPGGA